MKKKLLTVSLAALMLTSAGCVSTTQESGKVKEETPSVTAQQKENTVNKLDFERLFPNEEIRAYAQKMIGTKAPDFSFKNLKGEEVTLSKMKGQNVLVEIASTTCPACISAYPGVEAFKKMSTEQVKVLSVFPNEKNTNIEEFFKINNFKRDETLIAGEKVNNVIGDYQIQYTPTFLFVDKEGYIQFVHVGGDVDEVVLSSMSDLAFKTNLSETFNKTEEVKLEVPKDASADTENKK